jgi:adenylate cyclase
LAQPVKKLAGAMDAVACGALDTMVEVGSSDELVSLACAFNKMTNALRDAAQVRGLFDLYLSHEVAQRILCARNPLELVAEERAVTVLSLSLVDLAQLASQEGLRQMVHVLNENLPSLLEVIMASEGVVTELAGDHLVAVWGAPNDVIDPEYKALRGAFAARLSMEKEGRVHAAAGNPVLRVRMGLCSGRVIAANVGSARRLSYRVLGGAVDLARQVEQLAQPGEILLSESTYLQVKPQLSVSVAPPLMREELEEVIPLYRAERLESADR